MKESLGDASTGSAVSYLMCRGPEGVKFLMMFSITVENVHLLFHIVVRISPPLCFVTIKIF